MYLGDFWVYRQNVKKAHVDKCNKIKITLNSNEVIVNLQNFISCLGRLPHLCHDFRNLHKLVNFSWC